MTDPADTTQRLDKWLWCVRFYKTRSLASDAIKNGRVAVNGTRAKPSRAIQAGDQVVLERPPFRHHITVCGLVKQRVSATVAAALYEESAASIAARDELAVQLKASKISDDRRFGKLTKKERRDRERLKRGY